mmetsp:Transcript_209/g.365  ORF Transcript_209/g.365 Transcript_209/m.365 type:complete len:674 (-) Transcript_209:202-2223(-)
MMLKYLTVSLILHVETGAWANQELKASSPIESGVLEHVKSLGNQVTETINEDHDELLPEYPGHSLEQISFTQSSTLEHSFPKVLWMYWDQGFQNLKSVDRSSKYASDSKCVEAMTQLNPTWDIQLLDKFLILGNETLAPIYSSVISNDSLVRHNGKARIARTLASDLLRLELLSRYGGVWADTSICPFMKLDEFIPTLVGQEQNGFYAPNSGTGLHRVSRADLISSKDDLANCHIMHKSTDNAVNSRSLATWFMAANGAHNPLIDGWLEILYAHILDLSLERFPYYLSHCSLTQARMSSPFVEEILTKTVSRTKASNFRKQDGRLVETCFDAKSETKDIDWYLYHCAVLKKQSTESVREFILSSKYSQYLEKSATNFHPFPQDYRGLHRLEFIDIPNTDGTVIEQAASTYGISWGVCKFPSHHFWKNFCSALRPMLKSSSFHFPNKGWKCKLPTSSWHCPPTEFDSPENKYDGVDTFAVVSNPYTRIIREYYWDQRVRLGASEDKNSPDKMNAWISEALDNVTKFGVCAGGHCIPSHKYIFYEGNKIVTHILRMENLTMEFRDLMDGYNLTLTLKQSDSKSDESALGISDLSPAAIMKINEWARMDFENFGYDMLNQLASENDMVEPKTIPTHPWIEVKIFEIATLLLAIFLFHWKGRGIMWRDLIKNEDLLR